VGWYGLYPILAASVGNAFARRGEVAGAPVAALTAWSLVYGTLVLALYALAPATLDLRPERGLHRLPRLSRALGSVVGVSFLLWTRAPPRLSRGGVRLGIDPGPRHDGIERVRGQIVGADGLRRDRTGALRPMAAATRAARVSAGSALGLTPRWVGCSRVAERRSGRKAVSNPIRGRNEQTL